jgi:hypothetical protein
MGVPVICVFCDSGLSVNELGVSMSLVYPFVSASQECLCPCACAKYTIVRFARNTLPFKVFPCPKFAIFKFFLYR